MQTLDLNIQHKRTYIKNVKEHTIDELKLKERTIGFYSTKSRSA